MTDSIHRDEASNEIDAILQRYEYAYPYRRGDICLDGTFSAEELRKIADVLDRIDAKAPEPPKPERPPEIRGPIVEVAVNSFSIDSQISVDKWRTFIGDTVAIGLDSYEVLGADLGDDGGVILRLRPFK